MKVAGVLVVAGLVTCLAVGQSTLVSRASGDLDRDGLNDDFEQALLQRFLPVFRISSEECDVLPAEFRPGSPDPRVVARNGTIYGQVFPAALGKPGLLEIHYYHLWARDCKGLPHDLDVENVSALVEGDSVAQPAPDWKALYWYAAAHEATACDRSHAIKASLLGAQDRGPVVWVSSGKHASFLDLKLCAGGCGVDRCEPASELAVTKVINLGEPAAPLNGATWVASSRWSLAAKMTPDFSIEFVARLAKSEGTVETVGDAKLPMQALISGSSHSLAGVSRGGYEAAEGAGQARQSATSGVSGGLARAGQALRHAGRKLAGLVR